MNTYYLSLLTEVVPVRVEEVVEEVGCLRHWGPPGGGAQEGVLIISIATVRSPVTQVLGENQKMGSCDKSELQPYLDRNTFFLFSTSKRFEGRTGRV